MNYSKLSDFATHRTFNANEDAKSPEGANPSAYHKLLYESTLLQNPNWCVLLNGGAE